LQREERVKKRRTYENRGLSVEQRLKEKSKLEQKQIQNRRAEKEMGGCVPRATVLGMGTKWWGRGKGLGGWESVGDV